MTGATATLDLADWQSEAPVADRATAIDALEAGRVIYLPQLSFEATEDERRNLFGAWSGGKAKHISFDPATDRVSNCGTLGDHATLLAGMMRRYATAARQLVLALLPSYGAALVDGRTSFRPVEIAGRASSWRSDDRLLHVDAFPTRPTGGARLLRVFSNVDPAGEPRVWQLGEPFERFAAAFVPRTARYRPAVAALLAAAGMTRSRRSAYDQLMLELHDGAKADIAYQRTAPRTEVRFASPSTWILFSDQILHAALAGRHALEQTFELPVAAQRWPERSPLRVLERIAGRSLV